jgi:WD40 repeat protein
MVKLRSEVLQTLQPAKIFTQHTALVNGLDFCATADVLVTSSLDDTIQVYDSAAGA